MAFQGTCLRFVLELKQMRDASNRDAKRQKADTKGFRNEYQTQVTFEFNHVIPYSEKRAQ
ncbi:hypothetical protein VCHA49P379_210034 [Vibrio chagasii]|nr:hypothetical protein VCHA49P379_210034 [Vibrio chagasii]